MMFWMNSKTFQDDFLSNERDKDILNAQYVLVSTRIRKGDGKYKNIIAASTTLYPNNSALMKLTEDDIRTEYFEQLDENRGLLATLILGSIEKKYNIIFLCTKNESKLKYLKYLSEYVFMEFDYPIYDYKKYSYNKIGIIEIDKAEIIQKCKKILKQIKKERNEELESTKMGRMKLANEFKSLSKKEMKKELMKRDLYIDNMSKKEMVEMFELFI
jgi:hypothetical protein